MKRGRHRLLRLLIAGASAGLLLSPVAVANAATAYDTEPEPLLPRPCTVIGTDGNDVLRGTHGNDVLCGLGGRDVLQGFGGDDHLYGGPDRDVLIGGWGYDELYGGEGDDLLVDVSDLSRENGGWGTDRCYAVVSSVFSHCERVLAIP